MPITDYDGFAIVILMRNGSRGHAPFAFALGLNTSCQMCNRLLALNRFTRPPDLL